MRFLFVPDTDQLTGRGVLDAFGLGFFSIGVGLGILVTYAAYSPPPVNLKQVAVVSIFADTVVSLVAGWQCSQLCSPTVSTLASGPDRCSSRSTRVRNDASRPARRHSVLCPP